MKSTLSAQHSLEHVSHPQATDFSLFKLPRQILFSLFEWADQESSALICLCRHVKNLGSIPGIATLFAGRPLYMHINTPCLHVTVCGMVMAVISNETKVIYQIDDGTDVLRVLDKSQTKRPCLNKIALQPYFSHEQRGIPDCYLIPKPSKSVNDLSSCNPTPDVRFSLGDVVKITGRVAQGWQGDRMVQASQISLLTDPNLECKHYLEAIRLSDSEYGTNLNLERLQTLLEDGNSSLTSNDINTSNHAVLVEQVKITKADTLDRHDVESFQQRQLQNRQLITLDEREDQQVAPQRHHHHHYRAQLSDQIASKAPRMTTTEARDLIASESDMVSSHLLPGMPMAYVEPSTSTSIKSNKPNSNNDPIIITSSDHEPDSSASVDKHGRSHRSYRRVPAAFSNSGLDTCHHDAQNTTTARHRKLRDHSKLPDAKVTESYFRLQLQRYILDSSRRKFNKQTTYVFCISDLRASRSLSLLANRVVNAKLEHRCKRGSGLIASTESLTEKVSRLYVWVIRKMIMDGFIVIAPDQDMSESLEPHRSSDAQQELKSDVLRKRFFSPASETDKEMPAPNLKQKNARLASIDLDSHRSSRQYTRSLSLAGAIPRFASNLDPAKQCDPNAERGHEDCMGDANRKHAAEEHYVLVTPRLLKEPVGNVLKRRGSEGARTGFHLDEVVERLRRSDQRFSRITHDSVLDALHALKDHSLVSYSPIFGWVSSSYFT